MSGFVFYLAVVAVSFAAVVVADRTRTQSITTDRVTVRRFGVSVSVAADEVTRVVRRDARRGWTRLDVHTGRPLKYVTVEFSDGSDDDSALSEFLRAACRSTPQTRRTDEEFRIAG